jgi:TorA maturation chaperone TorD
MQTAELLPDTMAVDLARECFYRFLAMALRDPTWPAWWSLRWPSNQRLAQQACDLLRDEAVTQDVTLGFGELPPRELDLQTVLEELDRLGERNISEYDRVFGLVIAKECPPYETEYDPANETFQRSQQLADIAGFYRAFGIEPSSAMPERPDHIALELEFMAFLIMKKRLALAGAEDDTHGIEWAMICTEAARKFFTAHLSWWVPAFAMGLRRKAGSGFYAALARVVAAWVPAERARLEVAAARMPVEAVLIERPEEQASCTGCAG